MFIGSMDRKDYKTGTIFTALSQIGGLYSVVNVFSMIALSLILSNDFWRKEAIGIMREGN